MGNLMEIGGFITSGAEIVNHDNSLSGNGTVDSPLGLNETVLYESSSVPNRITSFTVSERLTNFEYIRVTGYGYPGGGPQPVIIEFPAPANYTDNISMCVTYYCYYNDSNPLQIIGERFSTSDGLTYDIIDKKMLYWSSTGTAPTSTNSNTLGITKIIGINRKAQ